jgi:hypothetical protein
MMRREGTRKLRGEGEGEGEGEGGCVDGGGSEYGSNCEEVEKYVPLDETERKRLDGWT